MSTPAVCVCVCEGGRGDKEKQRSKERERNSWSSVFLTHPAFIFNDNSISLFLTAAHFEYVCERARVCVRQTEKEREMCTLNEIDGEDGFLNCC